MSGANRSANATVAAYHAAAVTTNDTTIIPVTRGLYVGTTGTLVVRMADSQAQVTFSNVPVGIFPVQVDMVYTASTASNIVALY